MVLRLDRYFMKINRTKFFDGYRAFLTTVGKNLNQPRVNALNFLLDMFERMPVWNDVRFIAYALATIHIETAFTYEPIQEFGGAAYFERRYGYQTRKGRELGNDAPGEGAKYSGKGFVQLTGEANYERMELKIREKFPQIVNEWERKHSRRFDLTDFAEEAKDPTFAFLIMTVGMFEGLFTGKRFANYINANMTDYAGARRIINGQDRAAEIAGYAIRIEKILRDAKVSGEPERVGLTDATQAGANTQANQSASPDNATEETQATTPEGDTQIVKTLNEQDVSQPAEVPEPERQGFLKKLGAGAASVLGGTILYDTLGKFSGIQFSATTIYILIVVLILGFLGFCVWAVLDAWKTTQKLRLEVDAKTDPRKKDLVWTKPD
jgi:putative chitinase